jgi:hypothetical protein
MSAFRYLVLISLRKYGGILNGHDDLLQRGWLGSRADLLAPLDERRVRDGEVDPEDTDRDHKDQKKDPGLPVVERSGSEEEQQPQQEGAAECGECLKEEFGHAIRFLSRYSCANTFHDWPCPVSGQLWGTWNEASSFECSLLMRCSYEANTQHTSQ